jgi:peptide/nickel transport system substrate-binding protein
MLIVSVPADADMLHPALVNSSAGNDIVDLLFDRLAEPPQNLAVLSDSGWTPKLADHWTWSPDSLSIAFHINPAARWHDGQPVTARDAVFSFEVIRDSATGSPAGSNVQMIDSVTVRDSSTFVTWFHRRYSTQFFDAAYQLRPFPEHVLRGVAHSAIATSPAMRSPVGDGQYRFVQWKPTQSVELVADTSNYRGRPNIDRVVFSVAPDPNTAVRRVLAGEADLFEFTRPIDLAEVAQHPAVRVEVLPPMDYAYLGFNLHDPAHLDRPHPIFADLRMRRALSMAIDHASIARGVLGDLGAPAIGPFTHTAFNVPSISTSIPYDTAAAARLLDSLGWKRSPKTGLRDKGGNPLAFSMIAPTSSVLRQKAALLLQEQFRLAGITANIVSLEFNVFRQRQVDRQFDANLNSWHTDPGAAGARQTWSVASARQRGGSNFGGYESPAFDALLDSGIFASSASSARGYMTRAYEVIVRDAPGIWLWESRPAPMIASRFHTTGMRPDAWWASLGQWSVPPAERLPRDKLGTATSAAH